MSMNGEYLMLRVFSNFIFELPTYKFRSCGRRGAQPGLFTFLDEI